MGGIHTVFDSTYQTLGGIVTITTLEFPCLLGLVPVLSIELAHDHMGIETETAGVVMTFLGLESALKETLNSFRWRLGPYRRGMPEEKEGTHTHSRCLDSSTS